MMRLSPAAQHSLPVATGLASAGCGSKTAYEAVGALVWHPRPMLSITVSMVDLQTLTILAVWAPKAGTDVTHLL